MSFCTKSYNLFFGDRTQTTSTLCGAILGLAAGSFISGVLNLSQHVFNEVYHSCLHGKNETDLAINTHCFEKAKSESPIFGEITDIAIPILCVFVVTPTVALSTRIIRKYCCSASQHRMPPISGV
jgi:hypothetical protein